MTTREITSTRSRPSGAARARGQRPAPVNGAPVAPRAIPDGAARERRLFGTDGVRGVANVHPMTAEMALKLGRALAYLVRSGPHRHRIVIGKDTRLSGYMLEQAIASGICSMGVDVMLCGPAPHARDRLPHPVHARRRGRRDQREPQPVPGQRDQVLLARRLQAARRHGAARSSGWCSTRTTATPAPRTSARSAPPPPASARPSGSTTRIGRYVVFLKAIFPKDLTLDGLTVVVDCAHGAAYHVAPAVLEELGAKVIPLAVKPDGKNINDALRRGPPGGDGQVDQAPRGAPRPRARRRRRPGHPGRRGGPHRGRRRDHGAGRAAT